MFRCALTGKVTKSGEKAHKLVVQTRPKTYTVVRMVKDEKGKPVPEDVQYQGNEIVKELTVSEEGLVEYLAKQR